MNRYERGQIEKIVQMVMEEFNITAPIYDMDAVVEKLQGQVVEVDSLDGVVAVEKEPGKAGFVIQVLPNQMRAYRNMALAQGLGALFLHMGYLQPSRWNDSQALVLQGDYQALAYQWDEFAANLMMPKQVYLDFVHTHEAKGEIDTFTIADYFGVTNGTAINRGKWLEVLQW